MSDLYSLTPTQITLYGVVWCGDCRRARQILTDQQVAFLDVDIDADEKAAEFVKQLNRGFRSVPTIIFPDGSHLTEPDGTELRQKVEQLAS